MPLLCRVVVLCPIFVCPSKNNEQTVSLAKPVHCGLVQDDNVFCKAGWWLDEMLHFIAYTVVDAAMCKCLCYAVLLFFVLSLCVRVKTMNRRLVYRKQCIVS